MKLLFLLLIPLLIMPALADTTSSMWPEPRAMNNIQIYKIGLTATSGGAIDYTSDRVYGLLYSISFWSKSATDGTVVVTTTEPFAAAVTSYDLGGGNVTQYFYNASPRLFVSGPMKFACSDGLANESPNAWVYVQR
jgi:hypothetical protein